LKEAILCLREIWFDVYCSRDLERLNVSTRQDTQHCLNADIVIGIAACVHAPEAKLFVFFHKVIVQVAARKSVVAGGTHVPSCWVFVQLLHVVNVAMFCQISLRRPFKITVTTLAAHF